MDRPYPILTCAECGETKSAFHFYKRSGIYKQYKAYDPRRYNITCKRCNKPAKPGQSRDEVKEVVNRAQSQVKRAGWRKIKAAQKAAKPRLTQNEYKQKVRRETRIKSMQYLAKKGCEECGIRDPRVLEYDHKDPAEKKRGIARLIIDGFGWSSRTLRKEIRKCRVLCSNCHRKHTVEQQGYYAHEDIQRELGVLAARHEFDL